MLLNKVINIILGEQLVDITCHNKLHLLTKDTDQVTQNDITFLNIVVQQKASFTVYQLYLEQY